MMRLKMIFLMILALCFFAPVYAQSTPTPYSDLEPITLDNAKHLVQLPGELTGVTEGFDVSPDGKQIAVARPDGVYLYDMGSFETPAKIIEIDGALEIHDPRYSNQGNILSITVLYARPDSNPAYTTRLQLWDLKGNVRLRELAGYDWLIIDPIFSPDDQFLAGTDSSYIPGGACCGEATSDLLIWSVAGESDDLPCRYAEECYSRYGIGDTEFSPDSKTLYWSIFDFPGAEIQKGQYFGSRLI